MQAAMIVMLYAIAAFAAMLAEAAMGVGAGDARRRAANLLPGSLGLALSLAAAAALGRLPMPDPLLDLSNATGPVAALAVLLLLVASDAAYWCWHRAQHAVPLLWRLHRLHHSDRTFDSTVFLRQHPLEPACQLVVVAIPVSALVAVPLGSAIAATAIATVLEFWTHLGRPVGPRILDRVVTGPRVHRLHHAADRRIGSSNYASWFPAIDIAMGTWRAPDGIEHPVGLWSDQSTMRNE